MRVEGRSAGVESGGGAVVAGTDGPPPAALFAVSNHSYSPPDWSQITWLGQEPETDYSGFSANRSLANNTMMMKDALEDAGLNSSQLSWDTKTLFENVIAAHPLELPWSSQIALIVIYSVTTILAVLGNLVAIVVLALGNRSKKGLRKYLINLAVSDLCMACFCMPFTFTKSMLGRWIFGKVMCPLVLFMQVTSVAVSVYTNVAIGIDRYLAVTKPVKQRLTKTKPVWIIIGTWLASFAFASVQLYVGKVRELYIIADTSVWQCVDVPDDYTHRNIYNAYIFCFTYLIPLMILAFVYYKIGYALWQRQTPGNADTLRDMMRANSLRRVTKMLLVVVIAFAVCWLPTHLFIMVIDWFPSLLAKIQTPRGDTIFFALFFACHWLAMSNSVFNPIIYCFMNESFRADFRYLMRRNPCRQCMSSIYNNTSWRSRSNRRRGSTRSFLTRTFFNKSGKSTSTTESVVSSSPPQAESDICHVGESPLKQTYLTSGGIVRHNEIAGVMEGSDVHKL